MKSIFQEPSPGKATRDHPAKGALSGYWKTREGDSLVPDNHHGSSVQHVPNAGDKGQGR